MMDFIVLLALTHFTAVMAGIVIAEIAIYFRVKKVFGDLEEAEEPVLGMSDETAKAFFERCPKNG